MKKHLIIHGDGMSGKTLFITSFLNKHFKDSYGRIDGKDLINNKNSFEEYYLARTHKALYFMDVPMSVGLDYFISLTGETVRTINSILIIELSEELRHIPTGLSFTSRFDVINTNTISYKDLMSYLNQK